jgi:cellulose synthase/poly-beta-1,6-N-acetylglucosamine synthase-like glycosyltransferase
MAMVSIVATVKNEEATVSQMLEALENQSLKPDEILVVDGGSEDGTIDVIKSFVSQKRSVKLILAAGANRGQGRNIGISAATSEIVALTDGGAVADRHWLKNLVKPFTNGGADFVAGVYTQSGESLFQKCIGILQYPNIKKLRANDFLASCRSVAFRKTVWETVGRWPEKLEKAEDTYFDLMVRQKGFRIALAKDAVVFWPARESFKELFSQYSSYSEWDVRAHLVSKLKIYRPLFLSYVLIAILLFTIFEYGYYGLLFSSLTILGYLIFSGIKTFIKTRKTLSFVLAACIKVTILFAETYGIIKGSIRRVFKKK